MYFLLFFYAGNLFQTKSGCLELDSKTKPFPIKSVFNLLKISQIELVDHQLVFILYNNSTA